MITPKAAEPITTVEETDGTFDDALARVPVSAETRAQLEQAEIVILPTGMEDGKPVFPHGTSDFLEFLRAESGATVNIGVEDDQYQELALYDGILIILGVLLCQHKAVGKAIAAVQKYIHAQQKAKIFKVSFKSIQDKKKRTTEFKFEGRAEDFDHIVPQLTHVLSPDASHVPHLPAPPPQAQLTSGETGSNESS